MALKCLAVVTSRSDERLVRQTLEACLHDSRQHTLNDSKVSHETLKFSMYGFLNIWT